jgi:hypothetical protein
MIEASLMLQPAGAGAPAGGCRRFSLVETPFRDDDSERHPAG